VCACLIVCFSHPRSEALFELVTAEENMPCILYLKDTEKTLLTSYERYANFKRQLDKISAPLVVIGSSIVSSKGAFFFSFLFLINFFINMNVVVRAVFAGKGDKAPGGGFLLSKSGGGTTLLDFALFDHISRMEERARDTSKGARILSRLLPNKIVVNPPKEGPELPKWCVVALARPHRFGRECADLVTRYTGRSRSRKISRT